MSTVADNNKRILKNTMLLYFRMFFIMAISLYTSRVVLKTLGVEDYGIYNVVGSVVAMMGVLNNAMSVSTQRYLTFEIGTKNFVKLKQIFSVCVTIYLILSIIILLLAETVGLWFLNTQLLIPHYKIDAANWVYQFSIFSSIVTLLLTPYNASIISHEKMNVYAYVSIIDVILKLLAVYILLMIPYDRLIIYGILIFICHLIIMLIYRAYCIRNFSECRYSFYWESGLVKELISYSGWNLFGSLSSLIKGQGLNILLNMFFNPTVNAARGIAYQINVAVTMFFSNFYTAVRPQITKYYAYGDLENMFKLVFRSSKLSYYLILLISLPIMIETPFIINLWLGEIPEYVVIFTRLILIITAIDSVSHPLMTTAHATGDIKLYQASVGTTTILNLPISYVFLKLGFSPVVVFEISICISIICLFMRLWIVNRLLNFPVKDYIIHVLGDSLKVTFISLFIPSVLYYYLDNSFCSFICITLLSIVVTIFSVYCIGLTSAEKEFVDSFIKRKFCSKYNKR